MSASGTMSWIYRSLSQQAVEVDDQIARLRRAKRALGNEQQASLDEIRNLVKPELDGNWKGSRARSFQNRREDARDGMKSKLTGRIDDYQQRIDAEISNLRTQAGFLDATRSMAYGAEYLMRQGEEAASDFWAQVDKIKGRLF